MTLDYSLPDAADLPQDAFDCVRNFLEFADYTEPRLCREFGVGELCELTGPGRTFETSDLLVTLLFIGRRVPRFTLEFSLPGGVLDAMLTTGLVREVEGGGCYCPALVYPIGDVWIASDRLHDVYGAPRQILADFVYLAFTTNTTMFHETLPNSYDGTFLELGCGAGSATLQAARTATYAVGTDIAARSVQFANWSRRLNGLDNVEFLCGDLYEPVAGRTFDYIAAHLPYEPSAKNQYIFADGGSDGEQILRRTIERLPEFLNVGGHAHVQSRGPDTPPYEERIRAWLNRSDFDLKMLARKRQDGFVNAATRLTRHDRRRAPKTERIDADLRCTYADFDR